MSENSKIDEPVNDEELDRACRWNAFVIHLHTKYRYLLNHDLAMQIAREAQEHFEEEIEIGSVEPPND